MSKPIRLDDDVLAYIAEYGKFGESHSDVLRRLLPNFPTRQQSRRTSTTPSRRSKPTARLPRGLARKQKEYKPFVAFVLFNRFGGKASLHEVLAATKEVFGARFNEYDLGKQADGDIRWEETAKFAVSQMRKEGLMVPADASNDGTWELTRQGKEYARELGNDPARIA